jgi:thymidylate synthase (FAD)
MSKSKVEVLDHGYVILADRMGCDMSVVRSARVSHNIDWRTGEDAGKDEKLIAYLLRNKHTSPFESVTFTFEVKAPIFVFRQWHRHRTWSYNEISARYSELPEEFYVPEAKDITGQSSSNKQMRTDKPHPKALAFREIIHGQCATAFTLYQTLLKEGCPRELARGVLPMNTYSRMFATVDLHNLFHFLRLRLHEHAQYEIRVYAKAMLELITPYVPVSVAAFKEIEGTNETSRIA